MKKKPSITGSGKQLMLKLAVEATPIGQRKVTIFDPATGQTFKPA